MKGLIIFIVSIIAFICLSIYAFWDMQTDMEVAGMIFTIMFALSFVFALCVFFVEVNKEEKPQKF